MTRQMRLRPQLPLFPNGRMWPGTDSTKGLSSQICSGWRLAVQGVRDEIANVRTRSPSQRHAVGESNEGKPSGRLRHRHQAVPTPTSISHGPTKPSFVSNVASAASMSCQTCAR